MVSHYGASLNETMMIRKNWNNIPVDLQFSQTIIEFLSEEIPSIDSPTLKCIYETVAELISNIIHHAELHENRRTFDVVIFESVEHDLTIRIVDRGISIPHSMLKKLSRLQSAEPDQTAINDSMLIEIAISGDQAFLLGRGTGLKKLASHIESEVFSRLNIQSRYGNISMKFGMPPALGAADQLFDGTAVEFSISIKSEDQKIQTDIEISVARDFSRFPAGRFLADGPHSGEAFKLNVLAPALSKYNIVTLTLDGALGYPSSFLEESFGGLVRDGFDPSELEVRLNLISETDVHLTHEIWKYIWRVEK
jgi:hypothetical protein